MADRNEIDAILGDLDFKALLQAEQRRRRLEILDLRAGPHLTYGSLIGPSTGYNFLDANVGFLPFGRDLAELESLFKMNLVAQEGCNARAAFNLEDVAREIVGRETDLDLSLYDVHTSTDGARGAISRILEARVTTEKPLVGFASPAWIFDSVVGKIPGAGSVAISACTADELVYALENDEVTSKLAAVLLVDPSNPLPYRFTREHIERLDELSDGGSKFSLIFDDVFRGLQGQGRMHSASRYSSGGIIVETTSKRFGARGLGATWTLVPKRLKIDLGQSFEDECKGCASIAAVVTRELDEQIHNYTVQETLIARTNAFIAGYGRSFGTNEPYGQFWNAFDGMPILIHMFEGSGPIVSSKVKAAALEIADVRVTSGLDWMVGAEGKLVDFEQGNDTHRAEIEQGASYIRICPTKEPVDRAFVGGFWYGKAVQKVLGGF